jgi:hypothetical protein
MESVCLVNDRIYFLLRHIANVWLLLIGSSPTRRARLDYIATPAQIRPRKLSQLPWTVGGLKSSPYHRSWIYEVEMRPSD